MIAHPTKQESRMETRGYVSVDRAADLAGVHPVSVRRWIAGHKVEVVRAGRRVFISLKSLRQYMGMVIPDQLPPQGGGAPPVVPAA